jgi:transglutaminase-like putative cysteine protease
MNGRVKLGLVAGAATLLAAAPIATIFRLTTWLVQAVIVVALIVSAATAARALRAPVWAQALAMLASMAVSLTFLFPSGQELLGVVPTPDTFIHFGELLNGAVEDIRRYALPVPDTDPLLFIAVAGIGLVAVIVDLVVVGLRRPALAGLPMLAIYSVPVAVSTDRVQPLTFAIAAAGFLWLLTADNVDRVKRFGRRFTGDGRRVELTAPSPLAAAGRRLAAVGIATAVLAPLAVPGMATGLFDNFRGTDGMGSGGTGTGGSGRVDLIAALSGQLRDDEVRDLVRVTTNEPEPFYLRFGVADRVSSDGFGTRNPGGVPVTGRLFDPRDEPVPGVTYQKFHAEVEITSHFNMPLLPIYSTPVAVHDLDSSWLYEPFMQVVSSRRGQSKGKKYSFEYVRAHYTPKVLDAAPPLPPEHDLHQFIAVPSVPEVEELVAKLVAGKETDYQRVRAIYDYFSRKNGFVYRLRTEGGTSGEDIVDFLNNKQGFCQQYAAAMAWLVRAAGIPARVAFGFTNGTRREEKAYILTNQNLHAWTEVYFHGIGWVPFDPTPASGVPGSTRSAWAPDPDAPDPVTPSPDVSTAPGEDTPHDRIDRDRAGEDFDSAPSGGAGAAGRPLTTWPWWTAVGATALLLLLAAPALTRIRQRWRRRRRSPDDSTSGAATVGPSSAELARAHAHASWDELIDTLVDLRVGTDPSETPRATVQRLITAELVTGQAADALRLLGRAEERARYARDPLAGAALNAALSTVRRALASGADRWTRIVAVLFPPSVLLRWRLRIVAVTTRILVASGRVRDWAARWSPHHILAGRIARRDAMSGQAAR